jgi:hypothetical protein
MMNEANETVFSNLADFIRREVEKIITLNLEHKPYDSLKSEETIAIISQQVPAARLRSSTSSPLPTRTSSTS